MKKKISLTLKIIIPIIVGVYLTWYFITNSTQEEKESFVRAFKDANYLWITLSMVVAFLSHLSRAYRWKFLLEPLGYKPNLSVAYHSVMIGYILNLTVPRSGEVARAAYYSKFEGTSAEKVFGTIVVERIIDLVMFGSIFFIALALQADPEQFNKIRSIAGSEGIPSWVLYLIVASGVGFVTVFFGVKKIRLKIIQFIKGVIEGCLTVLKLKNKAAFIFHTMFIWTAYIVMLWFTALALPSVETLPISAMMACFVAGAVAIGATPGGIGLYPIMVAAVLMELYNYEGEVAKSFSMLMWALQTIFIVVLGIISLVFINKSEKKIIG